MKHLLDFMAILLMGDGLAKLLSPVEHNRFYRASWAPGPYNQLLQTMERRPVIGVMMGVGMVLSGAVLSRWCEQSASR